MKKNKNQLYIQANKDWLVAKSQEDGVKSLPKGVYYKVLAEGDHSGATPTPSSVITAHYTGKTIDGATFDSSRGDVPLACRLRDLIEGWIISMRQMHIGDRWEVYIPAEMGYGKFSQPGIPPPSSSTSNYSPSINKYRTQHDKTLFSHIILGIGQFNLIGTAECNWNQGNCR